MMLILTTFSNLKCKRMLVIKWSFIIINQAPNNKSAIYKLFSSMYVYVSCAKIQPPPPHTHTPKLPLSSHPLNLIFDSPSRKVNLRWKIEKNLDIIYMRTSRVFFLVEGFTGKTLFFS